MNGSPFLAATQKERSTRTPIWFMRQAGRYMSEYRAIRKKASLLEICHTPELACEVTLQPIDRFDVDAAILFADILLPFEPMGLGLSFQEGEGPVIERPVRTAADAANLPEIDVHELGASLDAIRLIKKELDGRVPLIGFAGAPFTLASYAIEGGSTRQFIETKKLMYGDPETWHLLMDKLSTCIGKFLMAQADAGADALQIFDSWAGILSPRDYREYVLPHSLKAAELAAATGKPLIHFGTNTTTILPLIAEAGGDVIGVDWRIPLDEAWKLFPDRGIQGNLDPCALFAPPGELRNQVEDVMRRAGGRAGHIFNLGHGIMPQVNPDSLDVVIESVRDWDARNR